MERKTKVHADEGKLDLTITREFELPVELLFKAYAEPEIVEQWMGTKVLKLESKKYGAWQFETRDEKGNVTFGAHGVIHECTPNKRIIRTFEMVNAPFGVQLEVYDFEPLTADTSKLNVHIVFESGALRDELLKLPFSFGINMAHDRLQEVVKPLASVKK